MYITLDYFIEKPPSSVFAAIINIKLFPLLRRWGSFFRIAELRSNVRLMLKYYFLHTHSNGFDWIYLTVRLVALQICGKAGWITPDMFYNNSAFMGKSNHNSFFVGALQSSGTEYNKYFRIFHFFGSANSVGIGNLKFSQ